MKIKELSTKVWNLIEPVVSSLGLELVDIELNEMNRKALLRVFIDREEGVTIDDCTNVSREISALFDVEDPIPRAYVLEVSSPGIAHPFKGLKDYKKQIGKTVRVVTHEPVDKQTFFVGKLEEAGEDSIVLLLPKDRKIVLPYTNISKARLEVEI
jgi:ribosome maturation factor RimP